MPRGGEKGNVMSRGPKVRLRNAKVTVSSEHQKGKRGITHQAEGRIHEPDRKKGKRRRSRRGTRGNEKELTWKAGEKRNGLKRPAHTTRGKNQHQLFEKGGGGGGRGH